MGFSDFSNHSIVILATCGRIGGLLGRGGRLSIVRPVVMLDGWINGADVSFVSMSAKKGLSLRLVQSPNIDFISQILEVSVDILMMDN